MDALLLAILTGLGFIVAYHTYGKWLSRRIFDLAVGNAPFAPPQTDASAADTEVAEPVIGATPAHTLRDDVDYCPTNKWVVFGHHFTSIAGTGPIVGPAIAVIWGWLPALLWVVFGSIFIGAVHDFGSLVVSLRNRGQTVGEIAGTLIHPRVRVLFLAVLFLALTIVLAIFGLVIAAVFRMYPQAILPCLLQIPIAVAIGWWLHRHAAGRASGAASLGVSFIGSSLIALVLMYVTVIFGDRGPLHAVNMWLAGIDNMTWCLILLAYSGVASVLPVWLLLQPRDYINSLQLLSSMGLIVLGLVVAAFLGGAPPVPGADRQPLEIVAPMVRWEAPGAPFGLFPFLFITIACGAISGFHCMVSSGTSSKQLNHESDARFVGYGAMLTEGFLATLVILGCVAGLGLGSSLGQATQPRPMTVSGHGLSKEQVDAPGPHGTLAEFTNAQAQITRADITGWNQMIFRTRSGESSLGQSSDEDWQLGGIYEVSPNTSTYFDWYGFVLSTESGEASLVQGSAYHTRYASWSSANGLGAKVGAFIDGAGNFLKAMAVPPDIAVSILAVLVASFAGTTLDTATRLQRYVVQGLVNSFAKRRGLPDCEKCGYDPRTQQEVASGRWPEASQTIDCPECGTNNTEVNRSEAHRLNPWAFDRATQQPVIFRTLASPIGATLVAVVTAAALAAIPAPGKDWSYANAGGGGLILWPMFGATNQLLGGLAFMVIAFYLLRRNKPTWFLVLPALFMLAMPAWALSLQIPGWWSESRYVLLTIAGATLALEGWMMVEAARLLPKVRGLDVQAS